MNRRGRRGIFSIVFGGSLVLACNGLLDNDPRHLAPLPVDAGTSGAAGRGGSAGAAGKAPQGESGESGAGLPAGGSGGAGAGQAGEAGEGARSGAAGAPGASGEAGEGGEGGGTQGGNAGEAAAGPGCVGECVPGTTTMDVQPCGDCGTQTRSGTCSDACVWEWGEFDACMSTAECHPTAEATRTASCACGGSKGQKQVCGSDCRWGAWTDTSSCDLDCCTSVVYCDTPNNLGGIPASRGTWCKQETAACTRAEVDADCPSSVANIPCKMHAELYIEYL
jgi:hypothetical protein